MNKSFLIKSAIIFVITVAAVFFGLKFIFLNSSGPRSKAAADTINVSYDNASPTVASGSAFTVTAKMTPSADVSIRGYMLKLSFDKTKLQFQNIVYKLGTVSAGLGNTDANAAAINQNGSIYVQGEDQTATGSIVTASSTTDLVQLTFKALSSSGTTVSGTGGFYEMAADGTIETNFITTVENLNVNGGSSSGGSCTPFTDNFSGSTRSDSNWSFDNSNAPGSTYSIVNDAAQLNIPTSTNSATIWYGVNSKTFGGDFSAEVTELSVSAEAGKSIGQSSFDFNTSTQKSFRISRNSNDSKINWVVNNSDTDWNNAQYGSVDVGLTSNTPVKFELARQGTTIYMYYDLQDGKGYQLLKQFTNFASTDGYLQMEVSNWGPNYPATTSRFNNFALTCASGNTNCTSFTDNFSNGNSSIDTNNWSVWTNNSGTVTISGGEGNINNPDATADHTKNATFLNGKQIINGDFTVEAVLNSIVDANSSKNTGSLELSITDPTNGLNFIRIARYYSSTNINAYNATGIWPPTNNSDTNVISSTNINLTPTTPLKVKIVRTGNTASTYYDLMDGSGYKLIQTFTNVFSGPVIPQILSVSLGPDYPASTGIFSDFSLTCPTQTNTYKVIATCTASDTQASLSWPSVAGATHYNLRADDNANGWVNDCSKTQNQGDSCMDNLNDNSATITTVPGDNYSVWVDGVGSNGSVIQTATGQFVCGDTQVTGNVILNLKLKFQGIGSAPTGDLNDMKVKVTLADGGLASQLTSTGDFTSDSNGIWSGQVGFNVPSVTSTPFSVYVQGPHHLTKKICEATPTEANPGTYNCSSPNITLTSGDNNLDFSGVTLLGGDITGPNGTQDNVINSIDLGFILNNLGTTDAAKLALCDINLDGKCDTQDYSLALASLSFKLGD